MTSTKTCVVRLAGVALGMWAAGALAQETATPPTKVIVVPVPSDAPPASPPRAEPAPAGASPSVSAPEATPPPLPPPEGEGTERTFEALPPPPVPEPAEGSTQALAPQGPTAMLDGHPREGAFLSGPGSLTFILHHTLMTGFGGLATQMVPRAMADADAGRGLFASGSAFGSEGARLAYLGVGLGGAAVGFAGSAVWQFTHWMGESAAAFGIVNSLFGAMFLGSLTNLVTTEPYAVSWLTLVGGLAGGWLSAIVGGGELPVNHGALVATGGLWAAIYASLVVAIIATTGGAVDARKASDAVMLTPAIGAAALALATLKFNPSTAQIVRANVFGAGVGGVVLLLSALVLAGHFTSPVPYILAGVGAIGAQTLVSLLWVEAAENPAVPTSGAQPARSRVSPWW